MEGSLGPGNKAGGKRNEMREGAGHEPLLINRDGMYC